MQKKIVLKSNYSSYLWPFYNLKEFMHRLSITQNQIMYSNIWCIISELRRYFHIGFRVTKNSSNRITNYSVGNT